MGQRESGERRPRVEINKAAWRFGAIAAAIGAIGLTAALVAQTSLWSGPDSGQSDPLTTLALVLAILAFIVQIVVYVFQTNASNSALMRSEEVNAETKVLLTKVDARSHATQTVLLSNFELLLDYVVGRQRSRTRVLRPVDGADEDLDAPAHDLDGAGGEPTVEENGAAAPGAGDGGGDERVDVRALAAQVVSLIEPPRPTFERLPDDEQRGPDAESRAIIDQLLTWPSRRAGEEAVVQLAGLSPIAVAQLKRLADREVEQRQIGEPIGLRTFAGDHSDLTELIEAGLARRFGRRVRLSDNGRDVARVVSAKYRPERPSWYDEVLAPLLRRPPADA